jgi:hypothetical protein
MVTLDDGPGEQAFPVALATANGSHAMGVYSAEPSPGYGRFRFKAERVNKTRAVAGKAMAGMCSRTQSLRGAKGDYVELRGHHTSLFGRRFGPGFCFFRVLFNFFSSFARKASSPSGRPVRSCD